MALPVLVTKLFAPPLVARAVSRPRLTEPLRAGMTRKLTLVCAPAGFGKSSLLGEWAAVCGRPCAWVSLDPGERDLQQFLACLVAAVQTVDASVGANARALLQATPPPSAELVLTALLNDVAEDLEAILLVLDDCHLVASQAVDEALAYLIDHLPPQMHLALATRAEPALPLARLRAQGQLLELRQEDLRFGANEAAAFLGQTMALRLSVDHVTALAARTEGWVAGLQMAAISLRGNTDPETFIQSFTGNHRFLQDFLLEEVLHRQTPAVQSFLMRTSVLDRMCPALCNAVMQDDEAQTTLDSLERANLFIVPLDAERRWFRYHRLFAELLRQRLAQQEPTAPLLIRASEWHEAQGQPIEAFQQALAAGDIDRAMRLIDGDGMPLYFRGAMAPVVQALQGLSNSVLDRHPRLWVMLAWSLMISGYPNQMAVKLEAAVQALQHCDDDEATQDLWGQIAALKAWVAVARHDVPTIHAEVQRAFDELHPHNQAARTAAHCAEGVACQFEGNRPLARQAYEQVLSVGQVSGNFMFAVVATMGLASIQLAENQLHAAFKTYQDILQKLTDPTHSVACEAHLGLARIFYEWNDLDAAESHARRSSQLAAPMESGAGLSADAMTARVLQVRQRFTDANALLAAATTAAHTRRFTSRLEELAALQAQDLVRRGEHAAALALAQRHQLVVATARALSAQGDAAQALALLAPYRARMEQAGQADEVLKAMLAQALALHALGKLDEALRVLQEALLLAEPGGFVRSFVDEGQVMAVLLSALAERGTLPDYTARLLAVWRSSQAPGLDLTQAQHVEVEALSERELDILRLIQQGHSNQGIGETLFLSLHTVKWHNQNIFDKLQVKRRTEAVARALALKLLSA
jgi:LuxR family transcriptional regulator, maltose regulon positive regulatory protein